MQRILTTKNMYNSFNYLVAGFFQLRHRKEGLL